MSDKTYVGSVFGQFSTDANGGAAYSIPIQVPPGTARMEPRLSLTYNSAAGNGMLGVGWNLQGLSAITRTSQTPAQDGAWGAIGYNSADRFALDGQRLMVVNGVAYDDPSAVFHTEVETWMKVTPVYGGSIPQGGGPESFLVFSPDGSVREYGNTPDSRVPASASNPSIRVWSLNRVTDRNGNYLTFTYQLDSSNNANYPLRISYTANDAASLVARRAVEFQYESRTDLTTRYQGGSPVTIAQRMTGIRTFVGGGLVRQYTFAYNYGTPAGRSQLVSVTEADDNGVALPPTVIGWQNADSTIFAADQPASTTTASWQGRLLPMDYDGDGVIDLVNAFETDGYLQLTLFPSSGAGFSQAIELPVTNIPWYQGMAILPMDVNGDGCIDLVVAQENDNNLGLTVLLSQSDGNGGWQFVVTGAVNQAYDGILPWSGQLMAMDVDADGLVDLVYAYESDNHVALKVLFSNGSGFAVSPTDQTNPNLPWYSNAQWLPMDFNGDTMSDLVYAWNNDNYYSFALLLSAGRNGLIQQSSPLPDPSKVPAGGTLIPIDLNGDGLGDLAMAWLNNDALQVQTIFSNGVSFEPPVTSNFNIPNLGGKTPTLLPMDVDGDGLPDFVIATQDGAQIALSVLLNTGSGLVVQPNVTQPSSAVQFGCKIIPADFNGDGRTDLIYAFGSVSDKPQTALAVMPIAGQHADLANTFTNGLGGSIAVTYKPLTDSSVYSETGAAGASQVSPKGLMSNGIPGSSWQVLSTAAGPLTPATAYSTRLVLFPKYVVASYTKGDLQGDVYNYAYFYDSARMDLTGRGWLGFAWQQVTDLQLQTVTTSNYLQSFPLAQLLQSHTVARSTDGALMHAADYSYQATANAPNTGPGVQMVTLQSVSTSFYTFAPPANPVADCVEVKSWEYDTFGQQIFLAETGSAWGAPLYTAKVFINDPIKWRIGCPQSIKRTTDAAGEQVLSWEQRTYDSSMNLTTRQLWNDQAGAFLTMSYTVDACGNPTSIQDSSGATTLLAYDATYHTFIATKTSPPNRAGNTLVETYQYYPQFGIPKSKTDANGVTLTYPVDGLGRDAGTEGPGPQNETVTLRQVSWNSDSTGIYVETDTLEDWDGGMSWEKKYLDGFARPYRTASLGPDGATTVNVDVSYNSRNQILSQSLPYYEGSNSLSLSNQYDNYGRLVTISEPQGNDTVATTISYQNTDSVTQTEAFGRPDQRISSAVYSTFNGQRLKVKQTDANNGVTTFAYDPLGRLISVVDPIGVTTATAWDSLGRKLSLSVESGGAVCLSNSFTYSDAQRTVVERDGKLTRITQQYDALRRLVSRTVEPRGEPLTRTVYEMDDPSKPFSQGRVSAVSGSGASYSFEYDAYGNQTGISISLQSELYSFQKTYDPKRRTLTHGFPDGSLQSNQYNLGGQLASVTLTPSGGVATQIVSYSNFDPFGAPGQAVFGSGGQANYGYDQTGRLTSQSLAAPGGALLANATFSWNDLHALTSIQDQITTGNSETFGYDSNGRLNSASGSFGQEQFTYDAGGNLTLKDGVQYSGDWYQAKSGSLNGAPVFAAKYDANGNMISATRNGTTTEYLYDADNQLIASGGSTMLYDHAGRRVAKKTAGGITIYYPAPYYEVAVAPDGSRQHTIFVFGGTGVVASMTAQESGSPIILPGLPGVGTFYEYADRIRTTQIQTDSAGAVTTAVAYSPFGEISSVTGPDTIQQKFSGKAWDADLQLYYFGARYYDPVLGRFITADDRLGARLGRPDALHRYAYGLNDPINSFDPLGHSVGSDIENFFTQSIPHFFTNDFTHFFTKSIPAFFENQLNATIISYIVDGALIIAGIAILATTPFGGPASTILGSTLLGAGIGGLTYNIETSVSHKPFQWGGWGIQLGIGGATGLIAGAVAAPAGAAADFLAQGGRAAFAVGGVGRIALNVGAGIIGNSGASVVGQLINNVDPYQTHHGLTYGLGSAAIFGAITGGISSGFSEGIASKLSVSRWSQMSAEEWVTLQDEAVFGSKRFSTFEQWNNYVNGPMLMGTAKEAFLMMLPGLAATGASDGIWANWHPGW